MSAGRDSIGYLSPPGFWYSRTQEEYDQLPGYRELNGKSTPMTSPRPGGCFKRLDFP